MGTLIFYNTIFICSTIFVFFREKSNNLYLKFIFLVAVFFILTLPAAFRYNIGSDYWSYLLIFQDYKNGVETGFEPGMNAIYYIVNIFDLDSQFIFIFSSAIIYLVYIISLPEKNATIYHVAYMSYCYLSSYNLIRSALAFSFTLLFIKILINKGSRSLLFLVLITSIVFHKSSLFVLIFVFVFYLGLRFEIHKSYKANIFILFLVLVFFVFRYEISSFLISESLVDSLGYGYYFGNAFFEFVELNSGLGLFIKILPVLLMIVLSGRIKFDNNNQGSAVIISGYFFILSSIMMATIEIFSRVQRFFIFGMIYCGVGLHAFSNALLKKILISIFIFNCILFYNYDIFLFKSDRCDGSRINPYVSIFNAYDDKSWSGIEHVDCMGD